MTDTDALDAGLMAVSNRYWFDTEFIEDGKTIKLVSIGIVSEDGRTYYAEVDGVDYGRADQWPHENVFPHLTGERKPREQIATEIVAFVGEKPEFWAYYADYDWVALCQLYGRMIDLPKGWPMYCRDVKQMADAAGVSNLPKQTTTEHHALADAIDTKAKWDTLRAALKAERVRGEESMRERAAGLCDDYLARMAATIARRTEAGKPSFVAECKEDAAESLAAAIRALSVEGNDAA